MKVTPREMMERNEHGKLSRKKPIVQARQMFFYLATKIMGMSLTETGRIFEQHHATVFHGCRLVENEAEIYPEKKKQIESILRYIKFEEHAKNPKTIKTNCIS